MSEELNMNFTLKIFRGGDSLSKFMAGGGSLETFSEGGPV